MTTPTLISFYVNLGNKTQVVTSKDIENYAEACHLNLYAEGRYSWLFVLHLLLYNQMHGINPFQIVDEIRALEQSEIATRTKPAAEFSRPPLQGLWHKHFFSAQFVARNIRTHLSGGKLTKLVEEIFDVKKSPVVTEDMVKELSHRVTAESIKQRADDGKLTGEWIVFAKHGGKNYYLCLATHNDRDQLIYESIKTACWHQFPFLSTVLPDSELNI